MLRLFFATYFVAVAVSLPFLPPYLRNLGLSGREVGLMLSLAPLCHLGVPLVWGWLADRTRRPDVLLRVASLGSWALFAPLVFVRDMPAMLFVYGAHHVFAVAVPGLIDALAVERVKRHGDDYGRIRVWGSLTFTATVLATSQVVSARGPRGGDPLIPILLTAALGLALAASLGVRGGGGATERPHARDVRLLARDPRFRLLLVVAMLHWASTAPYHGFFSILAQDRGLAPKIVGYAWVVSVVGEMGAFYFFRHLRRRFALSTLLMLATGASVARWLVVAGAAAPATLIAIQAIHTLTFGAFHATAVAWLGECVPEKLRATGQTLYTASVYGLGNLLGMLGAGTIYDATGGAGAAFFAAGLVELAPFLLCLTLGRRLDPASRARAAAAAA
jgi:PPP family 3-phenylpropionic acid transporter